MRGDRGTVEDDMEMAAMGGALCVWTLRCEQSSVSPSQESKQRAGDILGSESKAPHVALCHAELAGHIGTADCSLPLALIPQSSLTASLPKHRERERLQPCALR